MSQSMQSDWPEWCTSWFDSDSNDINPSRVDWFLPSMIYTVTAYAKLKGVTPETVRVWIHAGTLPNGDGAILGRADLCHCWHGDTDGAAIHGRCEMSDHDEIFADNAVKAMIRACDKITQLEAHCADLADRAALAEQQRDEAVKLLREWFEAGDIEHPATHRIDRIEETRAYLAKVQP